ncbi:hypothetical protein E1B28_013188 [Marasmius oreades]|uniref:Uncharacterized protein n=1 Tax=Marasmius oreades TaxID=181124 RepID=A0A9P7RPD2_9AGAR|nr:uncharacterized protein E1B28_013188 [Marasmius oreades]KAG7087207.1 hypothetical protein E1B28_013188 [Marasmius oreades]
MGPSDELDSDGGSSDGDASDQDNAALEMGGDLDVANRQGFSIDSGIVDIKEEEFSSPEPGQVLPVEDSEMGDGEWKKSATKWLDEGIWSEVLEQHTQIN